jgi:hypothetical protein
MTTVNGFMVELNVLEALKERVSAEAASTQAAVGHTPSRPLRTRLPSESPYPEELSAAWVLDPAARPPAYLPDEWSRQALFDMMKILTAVHQRVLAASTEKVKGGTKHDGTATFLTSDAHLRYARAT